MYYVELFGCVVLQALILLYSVLIWLTFEVSVTFCSSPVGQSH